MPSLSGNIRKMRTELNSPVNYFLRLNDQELLLNEAIGKPLSLSYTGEIQCVHCDRSTKKSFNQGYCYPCFKKLAQCDICIMKPEKCHFDAGTCREPEWGQEQCMRKHYVYFANTSGLKVGITRDTQLPTRWIDQGASAALPIAEVTSRHVAGLLEVILAQHVKDKTAWQSMLKGKPVDIDLTEARAHWKTQLKAEIDQLEANIGDHKIHWLDESEPTQIDFPVDTYPTKVKSLNFDKQAEIEGTLQGIKGQYLIMDTGVLNIRKFGGYNITAAF